MKVLDDIPFQFDFAALAAKVHVVPGSEDGLELEALARQVQPRARPKALYKVCYVEERGADTVRIGGATFRSRVLRANLDRVERVFAFVATCGREMDETPLPPGDVIAQFWLDTLKATALQCAIKHLHEHLTRVHALGKTAQMSPGSGDVDLWPIEQQKTLFALCGDVEARIGVRLTDSCLMLPNKSVSGIRFPTEVDFRSCQLCQREVCPSRGAPFDRTLFAAFHAEDKPGR